MQGFMFSEEELEVIPSKDYSLNCQNCGLDRGCITPYMKPYGKGKKGILLIGEAPGVNEDETGIPFVGKSGNYLAKTLSSLGIDMDEDCVRTNACRCHPKGNRTPTDTQIKNCRRYLYELIEEMKPKKIITFGVGLKGLIGHKMSIDKMATWVGWSIPDQDLEAMVFPLYHPAYVLRNADNPVYSLYFKKHLKNAVNHSGKIYVHNYKSDVVVLKKESEIIKLLDEMIKKDIVAFDYETSGLKPYNEGHRVYCASVSDGLFSYSFMLDTSDVIEKWIEFLRSDVGKIAHNMKFEEDWSRVIFKQKVNNWKFDTMLASHILDNRAGVTGLKFQTYVNFGVVGYDKNISSYIGAKDGNDFNTLHKFPKSELLQYCGEDSLYTYKLYQLQKDLIEKKYLEAYDLFHNATFDFSDMEVTGIPADIEYYKKQKEFAVEESKKILDRLESYDGTPVGFNPGSPKQVAEVLFDVEGIIPPDGKRSTGVDVLEKIDHPIAKDVLAYRRWLKIGNTYLDGFIKEISEDGKLHCFFNLNTVSSYRSSSSNINFQNIPARDAQANRITRGGLFPFPGQHFEDYDFKSIEVGISVCYHKDKNMLAYVTDESADMHKDQAKEIFVRTDKEYADPKMKELAKKERYLAKNGFVFAEFYGDYFVNCAKSIWERMESESREHLVKFGIMTLADFTEHMEMVENKFWNERFSDYAQWKEDIWKWYKSRGYVDYYTGFRASGIMSKNQVNNLPIQGTAFHVNLETIHYVNKRIKRWPTKLLGQVHDSQVFSNDPEYSDDLDAVMSKALGYVADKWSDWLIVPLQVKKEIGKVDEPWVNLEEIKRVKAS